MGRGRLWRNALSVAPSRKGHRPTFRRFGPMGVLCYEQDGCPAQVCAGPARPLRQSLQREAVDTMAKVTMAAKIPLNGHHKAQSDWLGVALFQVQTSQDTHSADRLVQRDHQSPGETAAEGSARRWKSSTGMDKPAMKRPAQCSAPRAARLGSSIQRSGRRSTRVATTQSPISPSLTDARLGPALGAGALGSPPGTACADARVAPAS